MMNEMEQKFMKDDQGQKINLCSFEKAIVCWQTIVCFQTTFDQEIINY